MTATITKTKSTSAHTTLFSKEDQPAMFRQSCDYSESLEVNAYLNFFSGLLYPPAPPEAMAE
jgi:hypothetical protein